MACSKREKTGSCGHFQCPFSGETTHGYECVEIDFGKCEVGEGCLSKCQYSFPAIVEARPALTAERKRRVEQDWGRMAQEPIQIEEIGGEIYAFGSELACLRIEQTMRTGRAKYSENRKTWTYCVDR